MTHTLHRQGDPNSLSRDYVIFAIAAQGINSQGADDKFRKFAEIVLKYEPVNYGDMKQGNKYQVTQEEITRGFLGNSIMHAVFTNKDAVVSCLKEIKEADIGLSIVVSGLIHDLAKDCCSVGITPHTVEQSLGIHGATERLPTQEVLDISTMCGHGMVAFSLIEYLVDEIKAGRITVANAADELARECVCGIFNSKRAAEIIKKML